MSCISSKWFFGEGKEEGQQCTLRLCGKPRTGYYDLGNFLIELKNLAVETEKEMAI